MSIEYTIDIQLTELGYPDILQPLETRETPCRSTSPDDSLSHSPPPTSLSATQVQRLLVRGQQSADGKEAGKQTTVVSTSPLTETNPAKDSAAGDLQGRPDRDETGDKDVDEEDPSEMQVVLEDSDDSEVSGVCEEEELDEEDDDDEEEEGTNYESSHSGDFRCTVCDLQLPSKFKLQDHMNLHTGARPYCCAECGKRFCQIYNYRVHLRTHAQTKVERFQCRVCLMTYVSQKDLKVHQSKTHFENEFYECDLCKRVFTSLKACEAHVQSHKCTLDVVCDKCGRSFSSPKYLARHRKTTCHRSFKCTDCPMTFAKKNTLLRHSFTHLGMLPYTCIRCRCHFRLARLYRKHKCEPERIHCVACLREFLSQEDFQQHKKDTGCWGNQEPKGDEIRCLECGQRFDTSEELKKHAGAHQRVLKCAECGKGFRSALLLMSHMGGHAGNSPCLCQSCGLGFPHQQNYDSHLKTCGQAPQPASAPKKRPASKSSSSSETKKVDTKPDSTNPTNTPATPAVVSTNRAATPVTVPANTPATPAVVSTNPAAVSTNPAAVSKNSAAVSTNSAAVSNNPVAVSTNQAAVATNPAAVSTNPAAVSTNSAAVSKNSAAVSNNPAAVSNNPAAVSTNPAPVSTNPAPASTNPAPVSSNPAAVLNNSAAVSTNPAAVSNNPVAVSTNPAAVSTNPAPVSSNPAAVLNNSAAVSTNPAAVSNNPVAVSNNPVAVSNKPAPVSTNPAAVSKKPAAVPNNPVAVSKNLAAVSKNLAAVSKNRAAVSKNRAAVPNNPVAVSKILAAVSKNRAPVPNNPVVVSKILAAVSNSPAPVSNSPAAPVMDSYSPGLVTEAVSATCGPSDGLWKLTLNGQPPPGVKLVVFLPVCTPQTESLTLPEVSPTLPLPLQLPPPPGSLQKAFPHLNAALGGPLSCPLNVVPGIKQDPEWEAPLDLSKKCNSSKSAALSNIPLLPVKSEPGEFEISREQKRKTNPGDTDAQVKQFKVDPMDLSSFNVNTTSSGLVIDIKKEPQSPGRDSDPLSSRSCQPTEIKMEVDSKRPADVEK